MRHYRETYKGYDIMWDSAAKHFSIKKKGLDTQMNLFTLKSCKTVIDTYERRLNGEEKDRVFHPPISEEKLNEVIDRERPPAEYSNKNNHSGM